MASIQGLTFAMGVDNSQLRRGLNEATRANTRYANRARNTFNQLGRFLGGGAILGGLNQVIQTTTNFDTALRGVQAVTGATGDAFDRIAEQSRNLGATTQFTATQAAEAQTFLGRAGFDTNEILAATPGLLSLAAAGQLDLARAADIASNVVQGFNLEAEQTGRVGDILAEGAANANTNVEQLGSALSFVAPVSNSLGVSIEDTVSAIGALSDAGIQGERAGTGLRRILLRLTDPTTEAAAALEEAGIVTTDAQGNFVGLTESLTQFEDAVQSGSLNQQDLTTIFGLQGFGVADVLITRGTDALSTFSSQLAESAGSADEQAAILNSGPAGAFRSLSSAIESVQIAIGESGLIDLVAEFATNFADIVRSISGFVREQPALGGAIAAIGAAIGLLLVAGGPITLFVAALAGIVAFWPEIMMGARAALNAVSSAFDAVLAPIRMFVDNVRQVGIDLGILEDPAEALLNQVNASTRAIRGSFVNVRRESADAREEIVSLFEGIGQGTVTVADATSQINALMEDMAFVSGRSAMLFRETVLRELEATAQEAVLGSIVPDMVDAIEVQMDRLGGIAARAGMRFNESFTAGLDQTMRNAISRLDSFRGAFNDGFRNILTGTGSTSDLVSGLLDNVTNSILDGFSSSITAGLFGASGGAGAGVFGAGLGSFFGGFFQNGGRPPRNRVSVVGEAGPELFIPDSAGTIVPGGALGGVTVNLSVTGNVDDATRRAVLSMGQELGTVVQQNFQERGII